MDCLKGLTLSLHDALYVLRPTRDPEFRSANARTASTPCSQASAGRWALVLLLAASVSPVMGAGTGHGFAWANNTERTRYAPDPTYAFNSAGGRITITRSGVGTYQVTFAGLGGDGTAGGNVQVTAYGAGSETCKVSSWNSGGADFIVNVRCHDARGRQTDTRYSVHVQWPQDASTTSQGPAETSREILPDGKVLLEYSDGSSKLMFDGGFTVTTPDGEARTMLFSTQAPVAAPPSPPDGTPEQAWLEFHSRSLLDTISQLVDFDQASIDNYLAAEGNAGLYDRIAKRRKTLDYMVGDP